MSVPTALVPPREIQIQQSLENALDQVVSFVPKLLIFLVVLFIGWIIAKVVAKALGLLLGKLGFDTLLAKAGAGDLQARSGIDPAGIITKLVYYFILLLALQSAFSISGVSGAIGDTVNDIVAWLPKALVAVVIVVITMAIANAVKDILRGFLGGASYGELLTNIVGAFIIGLGVIAALNQVGIGTTVTGPVLNAVLLTIGGVIVVGVGGGLIKPMAARWEGWLNNIQAESSRVKTTSGAGATGTHTATTTAGAAGTAGTTAPRAPGAPGTTQY